MRQATAVPLPPLKLGFEGSQAMSPAAATTGSAAWDAAWARASPRAAQRAMGSFTGGDCNLPEIFLPLRRPRAWTETSKASEASFADRPFLFFLLSGWAVPDGPPRLFLPGIDSAIALQRGSGTIPGRRSVMIRRVSWGAVAGALAVCLLGFSGPAQAAPPAVGTAFVSVTLNGVRLGEDFTPNFYSLFPTIVFDPSSGVFHMWVFDGSAFSIHGLRHAVSTDGVHFTSTGNLSYLGGQIFPGFGALAEPTMEFVRAARVGADWKLLMWTPNGVGNGQYNYNI